MKQFHTFLICILCALSGAVWFAFKQEWIIIQFPPSLTFAAPSAVHEQPVALTYWRDDQWHTETQNLLCAPTTAHTVQTIVSSWLTYLHDEGIIRKKITLQSALIDETNAIAYLSFDRSPLDKEWSTHEKWMFVEGLLKTIRQANVPIQSIYFLVNHRPLIDPHLDFSHAWPRAGYANS